MAAIGLNHVSVGTDRFEETIKFYENMFGLEQLPTPNFGFRTQWMRCGSLQVHVFENDQKALRRQHFALDVDDFVETYNAAKKANALDTRAFGRRVTELPDGSLQMYLRDPGGNLVEVNWPDASTIDRCVLLELTALSELLPQDVDNRKASLYLDRPEFFADQ